MEITIFHRKTTIFHGKNTIFHGINYFYPTWGLLEPFSRRCPTRHAVVTTGGDLAVTWRKKVAMVMSPVRPGYLWKLNRFSIDPYL